MEASAPLGPALDAALVDTVFLLRVAEEELDAEQRGAAIGRALRLQQASASQMASLSDDMV